MWPLKEFLHVVKRYGINSGSQEMSSDIYVIIKSLTLIMLHLFLVEQVHKKL